MKDEHSAVIPHPSSLRWEPILETDRQLVEHRGTVQHRFRPGAGDVPVGEKYQLSHRLGARERAFAPDNLSNQPVVALDQIDRVDQAADVGRIVEHRRQVLPAVLPRPHRDRVGLALLLGKPIQLGLGRLARRRPVDRLEIRGKRLAVLPGDVGHAVPHLVDDTALNICTGKDRLDGGLKARQAADAAIKDVVYSRACRSLTTNS